MDMSVLDVLDEIKSLRQGGNSLSKKKVKQSHPQLMRYALHYFPSWEHAIRSSEA